MIHLNEHVLQDEYAKHSNTNARTKNKRYMNMLLVLCKWCMISTAFSLRLRRSPCVRLHRWVVGETCILEMVFGEKDFSRFSARCGSELFQTRETWINKNH